MNRRTFINTLAAGAAGTLASSKISVAAPAASPSAPPKPAPDALPTGKIGSLTVSRMLLGGNLLTHFTHSRDLKYVYNLCAHYNTDEKIMETLALAEKHGINTLSMHNPPRPMSVLQKYRQQGGKIQWIICPTAPVTPDMKAYTDMVRQLVDIGCDAIYLWGVRADPLAAEGKVDLIAKAVEVAKDAGVPSGVGCHDLNVVSACEAAKVPCDFYIKTFHHHNYPSGPKPEQLKGATAEHPGYWCRDPQQTIEVMQKVTKPWIAFKIMAAGAIPPADAFKYVFTNGADHALVGMFDFEIAPDVALMKNTLANLGPRQRPWRS
jgi:hypothetical protein